MKGINDYIIEIKNPFKETITTKGGLELYANKDFSADKLSNRIGIVKETPFSIQNSEIEIDFEVLIDPTILYEQIYRGIKQESIHLLDRDKMLFKIEPKLIVLYRKDKDSEWIGFLENCLCEPILKEKKEITKGLILLEDEKDEFLKDRVIVKYINQGLKDLGIEVGDTVAINKQGGIVFWLDGIEYWWLRVSDIIAKL
jgi:co-chaperonin GroES (HSP10)